MAGFADSTFPPLKAQLDPSKYPEETLQGLLGMARLYDEFARFEVDACLGTTKAITGDNKIIYPFPPLANIFDETAQKIRVMIHKQTFYFDLLYSLFEDLSKILVVINQYEVHKMDLGRAFDFAKEISITRSLVSTIMSVITGFVQICDIVDVFGVYCSDLVRDESVSSLLLGDLSVPELKKANKAFLETETIFPTMLANRFRLEKDLNDVLNMISSLQLENIAFSISNDQEEMMRIQKNFPLVKVTLLQQSIVQKLGSTKKLFHMLSLSSGNIFQSNLNIMNQYKRQEQQEQQQQHNREWSDNEVDAFASMDENYLPRGLLNDPQSPRSSGSELRTFGFWTGLKSIFADPEPSKPSTQKQTPVQTPPQESLITPPPGLSKKTNGSVSTNITTQDLLLSSNPIVSTTSGGDFSAEEKRLMEAYKNMSPEEQAQFREQRTRKAEDAIGKSSHVIQLKQQGQQAQPQVQPTQTTQTAPSPKLIVKEH